MSEITRRSFLDQSAKGAAGVAAVAGAGNSVAASSVRTTQGDPVDKLHVGLIGSGGMGKSNLRDFLRLEEIECLAVADVDEQRVESGRSLVEERRGKRPDGYRDFRRIIDRKDIDAVIVGTPDHWHALPTIIACQAGKDVYVEKPLATSIEEGRAAQRKQCPSGLNCLRRKRLGGRPRGRVA